MTTPVGKKVDPAAATVGSAEDSATGFELALYPDAVDAAAHHQGVVVAYADGSDDAVAVTSTNKLPVTGTVSVTGTPAVTVSGTVTTSVSGTVTVAPSTPRMPVDVEVSVPIARKVNLLRIDDDGPQNEAAATVAQYEQAASLARVYDGSLIIDQLPITLRTLTLRCDAAVFPNGTTVDVYIYDEVFASITPPGSGVAYVGNDAAKIVGKVTLSGQGKVLVGSNLDVMWTATANGAGALSEFCLLPVLTSGTGWSYAGTETTQFTATFESAGWD